MNNKSQMKKCRRNIEEECRTLTKKVKRSEYDDLLLMMNDVDIEENVTINHATFWHQELSGDEIVKYIRR